jgi:hypothetical protein
LLAASVFGGDGFDERDPRLFGGGCIVTNAAWNNEEFTGPNQNIPTVSFGAADAKLSAEDEKHFILMGMRMPRELSLDTHYLDVLIVDLTYNSRRPKLGESATREFQRDRMQGHRH